MKIYFDHDALEGPKRILSSRFLTNKGGKTLAEAELKARLILGGHKDPDMGKYPTLQRCQWLRRPMNMEILFVQLWRRSSTRTLIFLIGRSSHWQHYLVIDAKTEFDVLNNDTQTSDRKIQIDLAVLKQALMEGNSNAFVRWNPGHHMIDGTTKWYDNGALCKALAEGIWSLRDTSEASDLRRGAARKRQAYRKAARKDQQGDVSKQSHFQP